VEINKHFNVPALQALAQRQGKPMEDNNNRRSFIKRSVVMTSAIMVLGACRSETEEKDDDTVPASALRNSIWLPDWRMRQSLQSALSALAYGCVDTVSPFWYELNNAGELKAKAGSDGMHIPDKESIALLKQNGARVTPTITTTLMPDNFIQLYRERTSQQQLATAIADVVTANDYDGIDLDLEYIALTTDSATAEEVRAIFTSLCQCISFALWRIKKLLMITVMPRWSDRYDVWRSKLIPAVYDYQALSLVASILRVIAYDQHAPNTPPGPIAGFEWVKSICRWTQDNVCAASRVEIGIPLYGRDWGGGKVKSVLFDNLTALRKKYPHSALIYNDIEKEETLSYVDSEGAQHTVWYSSDRSVKDRLSLIKASGFRGGAFWAASYESPLLWESIRPLSSAL